MLACDRGQDSSPQQHLQLDSPDGRELLGAEQRAHGGAGDAVAGYWALREPLPLHMGSEQTSQVVPNSLDPISLQVQTLILWSASPCLAVLQAP